MLVTTKFRIFALAFPVLLLSENVKIKMYGTIIIPVVSNGCETRSVTLSEEHRLRVFETRVLMRIFGPKKN
jgi:hypothetical protein